MRNRIISGIMLTLLLISMLTFHFNVHPVKSESATIIVPDDYLTIGEAIDAAFDGDTIYVRADTYYEQITIYKPLTLQGENRDTTIIDGGGVGDVVTVEANNVNITNFTIRNSGVCNGGGPFMGLYLIYSNNCMIIHNNISNNCVGVYVLSSDDNEFLDNVLSYNVRSGIYLLDSKSNDIDGNSVFENGWGIVTRTESHDTHITDNSVFSNAFTGIQIGPESEENIITSNIVTNNDLGVYVLYPGDNTLSRNNITSNKYDGILLADTSNNMVTDNTFSDHNEAGIYVYASSNNTFVRNNVTDNGSVATPSGGILLEDSNDNKFYYNNAIGNIQTQVYSYNSTNIWDNGYPSGGNYWSDYAGVDLYSGPYQNETWSDGIGDTSYVVDVDNQDQYPFMNPCPPWGDWKHYHNYTEIIRTLFYLYDTYPDLVDIFSIGKSWQNRDIYCIRLTNEKRVGEKTKLLFVGYHHARELISAELPLYFAVETAANYGANETIKRILDYCEIYIVPALNPDAFDAVDSNEWHRKNVHPFDEDGDMLLDEDPPDDEDSDGYIEDLYFWNGTYYEFIRWEGLDDDGDGLFNEDWVGGVDLNRNYGYEWNATVQSGSPYPWADDYRGPAPFSEPETQAMRDLALQNDFKYAISFHSGADVILYPWGYTTSPTSDDQEFQEIASNMSVLVGSPYLQAGQFYTTSGVWDDWMYGNRSTFAFTCEIYTNYSALQYEPGPDPDTWWEKGAFQYFNPNPDDIKAVIQRWLPVFTYLTNRAVKEQIAPKQFQPRADRLLIKLYNSYEAEFAAFEAGQIDVIDWPLTKSYVEKWSAPPYNESIEIESYEEPGMFTIDINCLPTYPGDYERHVQGQPNPTSVPALRHALWHLMDRDYVANQIWGGYAHPLYTVVPPSMAIYVHPGIQPGGYLEVLTHPYNCTYATEILDETGVFPVNVTTGWRYWDRNENGVEEIEEYLELWFYIYAYSMKQELGLWFADQIENCLKIRVNRQLKDYYSCIDSVMTAHEFNLYTGGWSLGEDPDHLVIWHSDYYWYPGLCPYNFGGMNCAEYDDWTDDLLYALSFEDAKIAAWTAQEVFNDPHTTEGTHEPFCACENGAMGSIPVVYPIRYEAHQRRYTGGTNGNQVTPDDGENSYRGESWQGLVNASTQGCDNWWSFLNMHPENHPIGDGENMTIRWGFRVPEINQLNPLYAEWDSDWKVLDLIYESLLERDPYTGELMPRLAESYIVSTYEHPLYGTCTKVVFTLRPDVTWADGTPFTAADVIFTLVELEDLLGEAGLPPPWRWYSNLQSILSVNLIDPYKLEVLLDATSVFLAGYIGENIILPKHVLLHILESYKATGLPDPMGFSPDPNLIGTGPYRLKEYLDYSHVLLVANRQGVTVTTNLENELGPAIPVTNPVGYYKGNPIDVNIRIVDPSEYENMQRIPPDTYVTLNVTLDNLLATTEPYMGWLLVDKYIHIKYPNGTEEITGSENMNLTTPHIDSITRYLTSGHYQIKVAIRIKGPVQLTSAVNNPWAGHWENATYNLWVTIKEDIEGSTLYDDISFPTYPYKYQLPTPDFKVDLSDVLAAALAFGSLPGHSRWNIVADINGDHKIDLSDYLAIAINFGWTAYA